MPEYLAPGVYVEETSFRAKSIEGVSTTTTGFVGPSRFGPIDLEPEIITSLVEFEYVYGDRSTLRFSADATGSSQSVIPNYLWHGVRAFFEEGGKRLYVSRIFRPLDPDGGEETPYMRPPAAIAEDAGTTVGSADQFHADGHARAWIYTGAAAAALARPTPGTLANSLLVRGRFPGAAGNLRVRITAKLGQNILAGRESGQLRADSLREYDFVWVGDRSVPIASPLLASPALYVARFDADEQTWRFCAGDDIADDDLRLNAPDGSPAESLFPEQEIRLLTLTVVVSDPLGGPSSVWANIALDPRHHSPEGTPDCLLDVFAVEPRSLTLARTLPIEVLAGDQVRSAHDVLATLVGSGLNAALETNLLTQLDSSDDDRSVGFFLARGNDGRRPGGIEYAGSTDPDTNAKTGLEAFKDIEDISIVAAPGCTAGYTSNQVEADAAILSLISHARDMRYRIAVLDCGDAMSISQVRAMRSKLDSSYAALYYPWVRVLDPVTRAEINLPPSGFVAGIYARNDINRAVYKAPANEVVNLALGFEFLLNRSQQEVLNPEGINCFRFFEGRGLRLWGARTISSDPEWKYVNVRRYFIYLERSIDRGTQWAVFEPNGEQLWANVRRTIEDFLLNEWQNGALLGEKPEKAFFVKCDRSTMTQNDLDNGRLVCLIGLAPLKPAEFVIFRIGQWTADRKV